MEPQDNNPYDVGAYTDFETPMPSQEDKRRELLEHIVQSVGIGYGRGFPLKGGSGAMISWAEHVEDMISEAGYALVPQDEYQHLREKPDYPDDIPLLLEAERRRCVEIVKGFTYRDGGGYADEVLEAAAEAIEAEED